MHKDRHCKSPVFFRRFAESFTTTLNMLSLCIFFLTSLLASPTNIFFILNQFPTCKHFNRKPFLTLLPYVVSSLYKKNARQSRKNALLMLKSPFLHISNPTVNVVKFSLFVPISIRFAKFKYHLQKTLSIGTCKVCPILFGISIS